MRLLIDPPAGLDVLFAPFDIPLANDTVLQPDVVVVTSVDDVHAPGDPVLVLAVEVLSPSTRLIDLNLKKARLEQAGVPPYWVVDPVEPMLLAWELIDATYVEVARVRGDETWTATLPFEVTMCPAELTR